VFAFLRKHANWLERKLGELKFDLVGPPPLKPGVPTLIPLRGETTRLLWRDGAYPRVEQDGERLILSLPKTSQQADLAGGALTVALVSAGANPPRRIALSGALQPPSSGARRPASASSR